MTWLFMRCKHGNMNQVDMYSGLINLVILPLVRKSQSDWLITDRISERIRIPLIRFERSGPSVILLSHGVFTKGDVNTILGSPFPRSFYLWK